jgi:hypothetical protein
VTEGARTAVESYPAGADAPGEIDAVIAGLG